MVSFTKKAKHLQNMKIRLESAVNLFQTSTELRLSFMSRVPSLIVV